MDSHAILKKGRPYQSLKRLAEKNAFRLDREPYIYASITAQSGRGQMVFRRTLGREVLVPVEGDIMFIDEARVYVKGGDGGNGIVAFRRKIRPPGRSGRRRRRKRGGNVVFMADEGLRTLMDFRYKRHLKPSAASMVREKHARGLG